MNVRPSAVLRAARQFTDTVRQIRNAESVTLPFGLYRHVSWQLRKLRGGFPVELELGKSRLVTDRSSGVGALVNCLGIYDFNNMNLLRHLLMQGPRTLVDVGANIGSYTLLASELPNARVISAEPHPHTFQLLLRNIALNGRSNITPLNVALSDVDGEVAFTDTPDLSINRIPIPDQASTALIPVKARRLDSLCEELKLKPELLKIDVEGHEPQTLRGFEQGLKSLELLFVERGERTEVQSLVKAAGMSGPFYVHFRRRMLTLKPQRRAEDPVYLRPSLLGAEGALREFTLGEGASL